MSGIEGRADPAFQGVADRFAANFTDAGEVGASVCVIAGGRTVVDLWGGHADAARTRPWEQDTIGLVFSNTKAMTALCAQRLIDRGALDLDARVSTLWPEFARAGKADVTVRMLLNHTAGLPALRDPVPPGGYLDWDLMTGRLAAEAPFWEPEAAVGYHMTSFGWLVGEVVRRASGRGLGAFFREEVAGPLGLDLHIGLPPEAETRVAPMIRHRPPEGEARSEFLARAFGEPGSLQALAFLNNGRWDADAPASHRAEIGAAGGIGNARGLAGMFAPLAAGGGGLLSAGRVDDMRALSAETERDETLLIPTRFGQGFMLRMDDGSPAAEARSLRIGPGAFGHVGIGGSASFADPEARMAFAYTMNAMGGGFLVNERGQGLIDAAYAAL